VTADAPVAQIDSLSDPAAPMVQALDLVVLRGSMAVLRGVSLALRPGQCLHLAGANGSGKTTLLRALCGLIPPVGGTVELAGADATGDRLTAGPAVVLIPATDPLDGALTVGDQRGLWAALSDGSVGQGDWALDRAESTRVSTLSSGQRRRLTLDRLALEPPGVRLWLLDEPELALDATGRAWLKGCVARHLAAGGCVIVTAHTPPDLPVTHRATLTEGRLTGAPSLVPAPADTVPSPAAQSPGTAAPSTSEAAAPMPGIGALACRLLRRELRVGRRDMGQTITALGFLMLVAALLPIAAGPSAGQLRPAAGAILWIAVALAGLLSLERLLKPDFDRGLLDWLALSPLSLSAVAGIKAAGHAVTIGLPLALLAPVAGLMLGLPIPALLACPPLLLLGTASLSLLGSLGAALGLSSGRGALLIPVLILPLMIPILIFGAAALERIALGQPVLSPLLYLGVVQLVALALCPLLAGEALAQSIAGR